MTEKRKPGRPKGQLLGERVSIRLPVGSIERLNAVLGDKQRQGDFLRSAAIAAILAEEMKQAVREAMA